MWVLLRTDTVVHRLGNIYKSLVFMPTLIMRASDFGFLVGVECSSSLILILMPLPLPLPQFQLGFGFSGLTGAVNYVADAWEEAPSSSQLRPLLWPYFCWL